MTGVAWRPGAWLPGQDGRVSDVLAPVRPRRPGQDEAGPLIEEKLGYGVRDRRTSAGVSRFLKFNFTTGIFSLAGNVVFTKLLADAGMSYLLANGSAIVLCAIINFLLNDRLVFIAPQSK